MKLSPAEAKIHEQSDSAHAWSERDLVQLDPDHPGFRDASYRARRNEIINRRLLQIVQAGATDFSKKCHVATAADHFAKTDHFAKK